MYSSLCHKKQYFVKYDLDGTDLISCGRYEEREGNRSWKAYPTRQEWVEFEKTFMIPIVFVTQI